MTTDVANLAASYSPKTALSFQASVFMYMGNGTGLSPHTESWQVSEMLHRVLVQPLLVRSEATINTLTVSSYPTRLCACLLIITRTTCAMPM